MRFRPFFLGSDQLESEQGFTLLEVILSIAILMTLVIGFSQMMQSTVRIKSALSQDHLATHRMANAMNLIATDLQHAFIYSSKDRASFGISRRTKSIFRIETTSISDKVIMSTMDHQPIIANSKESDSTIVVYEVREEQGVEAKKGLFRGEANMISEDLKEEPPMRLLVSGVKGIKLSVWDGEKFVNDRWDSARGEWRDKLPRMIRIELEGYEREQEDDGGGGNKLSTTDQQPTLKYSTVVYLPYAASIPEVKSKPASIKWQ